MTFSNTIGENLSELEESIAKCKTQESKIIKCFHYYETSLSPSMVLNMTKLRCPLTSIRRAMTNLSNEGKLVKTDKQVKGLYGKREHLWCLPKEPETFTQSTLSF